MIWLSVNLDFFIRDSLVLQCKSLYLKPRSFFGGITYSLSEIQNARNSLLEQFKIIFIETNIEQTGPNNEYFIDCITKGTSSKLKLEYRIEFMKHQFDIVMRG